MVIGIVDLAGWLLNFVGVIVGLTIGLVISEAISTKREIAISFF